MRRARGSGGARRARPRCRRRSGPARAAARGSRRRPARRPGARAAPGSARGTSVSVCTGRKWIEVEMRSARERALELVARQPEAVGVDADDVEVERVRVARVARERLEPVDPGDALVVERELALARGRVLGQLVELDERDRGEHVGEVRLVAGDGDVVARAVAAAHQPQVADRVGDVVAVRRDEAALAGGDVLRRVEGEAGRVGEPAELAAAVRALGGVRGVLDHRQAERPDRIQVARLAGEVDGQDRLRPLGHRRRDQRPDRCSGRRRARRRRPASRRRGRSRSPSRAR